MLVYHTIQTQRHMGFRRHYQKHITLSFHTAGARGFDMYSPSPDSRDPFLFCINNIIKVIFFGSSGFSKNTLSDIPLWQVVRVTSRTPWTRCPHPPYIAVRYLFSRAHYRRYLIFIVIIIVNSLRKTCCSVDRRRQF